MSQYSLIFKFTGKKAKIQPHVLLKISDFQHAINIKSYTRIVRLYFILFIYFTFTLPSPQQVPESPSDMERQGHTNVLQNIFLLGT